MSNEQQSRLVASVTLVMPGQRRIVIKPTQTVPLDIVSDEWVENALRDGTVYWDNVVPKLSDVKALRPKEGVNVSSVQKGSNEDNPLDDGIDLVAGTNLDEQLQDMVAEKKANGTEAGAENEMGSTGDPALDAQLKDIVDKQQAEGIENADEAPEQKTVEINAETGERTETGGEAEFDDDVDHDAQVG